MIAETARTARPPLERMLRIHEALQKGETVTRGILARRLEVVEKTVQRDLNFMRDRLGLPVAYEPAVHGYRYTAAVKAFPTVKVTEGELLALLVARRALEQYKGTPFHRQLEVAFEKLTAGLQDRVSFTPSDELRAVSFKNAGLGKADLKVFNTLSEAVLRRKEVEFDYRKSGEKTGKRRKVRPYHLSHRENLWYLVGEDVKKGAMRTFALPRIGEVRALEKGFPRPVDFSPEKFFSSALGVLVGSGRYEVRIRFDAEAADLIRERTWHETQRLEERKDGEVELTLVLGALAEVERWVLGWGAHAEVLAPVELREAVQTVAHRVIARYEEAPPDMQ